MREGHGRYGKKDWYLMSTVYYEHWYLMSTVYYEHLILRNKSTK